VKFKEKLKKTLIAFKDEVSAVKVQFRTLKKEQLVSDRVVYRMNKMVMSAENMVTKCKISCAAGDIERIYENLDIDIPPRIKVALFLAY
jgi:hypothetical protein